MSNVDLSWMNVPGPNGLTWAQEHAGAPVDLSWMNVPGADGRTFAQNAEGLGWMNIPGPDGLTFIQKYQQGKLPGQTPIAPPAAGANEDKNAFSNLKENLQKLGLESMTDKVWAFMLENGTDDDAGTMLWIYQQPEFKARFPAFETLQKKYRGIQPAQYIMLERQYAQTMRGAGLSASFFDNPDDFTALIENDVSQAEFQERVDNGFKKVAQADPAVRDAFRQYFGIEGDAALAAFFIDPDRSAPKLAKAAQMAELGGAASTMGVQINADYAEKLTRLGVSQAQALAGFQKMQQQRGLFQASVNETAVTPSQQVQRSNEGLISSVGSTGVTSTTQPGIDTSSMDVETQQGIDFTFGTDVEVERNLERRLRQRRAAASGTTQQVVTNREGQTGIGTAD